MTTAHREDEHEFVVDGRRVYTPAVVRTWHETGVSFTRPMNRPETRLITLHWTGAENPPAAVNRNMKNASLSVHFVVDQFGIVWQMCDAAALCAHAAGVNEASVGIEIISRGDDKKVPTRGVERVELKERIRGRTVTYAGFTLEQEIAVVALVAALCGHYRIPMAVPTWENGDVRLEQLSAKELGAMRGVIGHLHAHKGKNDPGGRMLSLVHLHGISVGISV